MKEFVVTISNLEDLFYKEDGLYENLVQMTNHTSIPSSNLIHLKEERRMYLQSLTLGTLGFQLVILDFEKEQIHFKCFDESIGDINRLVYEFLTLLSWNFQPKKMSYVMERRANLN